MNKKLQTIESYNKNAKGLAEKFNNIGARIDDIEKGFSYIKKSNPKVVEIGCGNGRDAKEIIKHTSDYLGIDISEEMIKIAKEYAPDGKFEIADVEDYIFPKNTDIIFSFASLLHSNKDNVKKILERSHESLNERGIFFISLKYGDYQEKTKKDEFGIRIYYFYTPEIIKELVENKYKVVYSDIQELREQKWFTIVLKK